MEGAKDAEIFERAAIEDRVILSVDTDFGTLLAQRNARKPSVILFRWPLLRRSTEQAEVLLANLPNFADDLAQGSIVIIEEARIRVRALPIGGTG